MLALDYLRGFFIVVIIIDHLWRWPNLLAAFTGEGRLWVSAAEGFVIISGLLVGYIRGHKNREQPFLEVAKKLLSRAFLLYAWFILMTLVYTAVVWYAPLVAAMPWMDITKGDWTTLIWQTATFNTAQIWVHFLYLYAIFLALTPIAIWLLRKNAALALVAIITVSYIIGKYMNIEWLEWVPVFFLPTIAGYYLPTIQTWWSQQTANVRRKQLWLLHGLTGTTLVVSIITTYLIADNSAAMWLNDFFSKEFTLDFWRIILSFVWFVSFVLVFNKILPWLEKYTGWLLLPFGTRSLTAYIAHGSVVALLGLIFIDRGNIWYNTALGIIAILGVWTLLRLPIIHRILPR